MCIFQGGSEGIILKTGLISLLVGVNIYKSLHFIIVTIATLSSFDRYVSRPQKAQLQVRRLVSYSTIYTVRVHVRVTSTNPRTVTQSQAA